MIKSLFLFLDCFSSLKTSLAEQTWKRQCLNGTTLRRTGTLIYFLFTTVLIGLYYTANHCPGKPEPVLLARYHRSFLQGGKTESMDHTQRAERPTISLPGLRETSEDVSCQYLNGREILRVGSDRRYELSYDESQSCTPDESCAGWSTHSPERRFPWCSPAVCHWRRHP